MIIFTRYALESTKLVQMNFGNWKLRKSVVNWPVRGALDVRIMVGASLVEDLEHVVMAVDLVEEPMIIALF